MHLAENPSDPNSHLRLAFSLHELDQLHPNGGQRIPEAEKAYRCTVYLWLLCRESILKLTELVTTFSGKAPQVSHAHMQGGNQADITTERHWPVHKLGCTVDGLGAD